MLPQTFPYQIDNNTLNNQSDFGQILTINTNKTKQRSIRYRPGTKQGQDPTINCTLIHDPRRSNSKKALYTCNLLPLVETWLSFINDINFLNGKISQHLISYSFHSWKAPDTLCNYPNLFFSIQTLLVASNREQACSMQHQSPAFSRRRSEHTDRNVELTQHFFSEPPQLI